MREEQLYLLEFQGFQITNCIIVKKVNQHGRVLLEGYFDSEMEDEMMSSAMSGDFVVLAALNDKRKERKLFTGLIESYQVTSSGHLKTVKIVMIGSTKLLDLTKKKRSFQNTSITYGEISNQIKSGYQGYHCFMDEEDKRTGCFFTQYLESDWEFLKRLASHLGTCVIPYFQAKGIRFCIGVRKENQQIPLKSDNFSMEYEYHSRDGQEIDGSSLQIKTRELYDLGDALVYRGKLYYVYEVCSKLSGGELVHQYKLKSKGGFQMARVVNQHLPGVSLDGSILAVGGSSVKVQLYIDKEQDLSTAKWFPYSTVYSSPDGSGWYCSVTRS